MSELPYTSRKFDDCLYMVYIRPIYSLYIYMSEALSFYVNCMYPLNMNSEYADDLSVKSVNHEDETGLTQWACSHAGRFAEYCNWDDCLLS